MLECLRANRRKAHRIHVLRDAKGLGTILDAAHGLPVHERSRRDLDTLVPNGVHQGVVLEADPLPLRKVDAWLASEPAADSIVVALDGVEDPHNFGAIVRSASAFGAQAVLFAKDRAAPISPVSLKSAAGAMEHIDLLQATNLARSLEAFQKVGYWVAGLDADAPQLLWEADLAGRVVLVIGSEGKGIRPLVQRHCDFHLRIPLEGAITSLNASVSAAVALAECARQRPERPVRGVAPPQHPDSAP